MNIARKTILLGSLLASLGACSATHEWVKDGTDETKRQADMMACREEMSRYGGAASAEVFDSCMAARGYEKKVKEYSVW